jgi:hypothetical protein
MEVDATQVDATQVVWLQLGATRAGFGDLVAEWGAHSVVVVESITQ